MRILAVHPGASFSTHDVYVGLVDALRRQDCQIITYALDARIDFAGSWLKLAYRRRRRADPDVPKPTAADILYKAGIDLLERALRFQPDMVLIVSAMYLHPDIVVMLKRAGLTVGIVLTESPYDDAKQGALAAQVDIAWTNERASLPYLRRYNPNTHYLPHAFDPARHGPAMDVPEGTPAHDVIFVGTGFQERCDALAAVNWEGIDLGLYGTWSLLGSRSRLRRHVYGEPMDNVYAVAMYRNASIGLNLYRTSMGFGRHAPHVQRAESLNPRALELAACGVFTISDYRPEVGEVFGDLVPTCADHGDLEDIIRFYLDQPQERARIARALPDAVKGWTFDARAEQVLSDVASLGAHEYALAV